MIICGDSEYKLNFILNFFFFISDIVFIYENFSFGIGSFMFMKEISRVKKVGKVK